MRIEFSAYGTEHPTDSDRTLKLGPGEIKADMTLRLDQADDADMPTDVLAADLHITDEVGAVWRTSIRFTAEMLLSAFVDINNECSPYSLDSVETNDASSAIVSARYSSDDRSYRAFPIGDEVVNAQFKYTTMTFHIFEEPGLPQFPFASTFAIQFENDGSLLDQDGEEVEHFGFNLKPDVLLSWNRGIYSEDDLMNVNAPIPFPMLFSKLDSTGEPQPSVELLQAPAT